MSVPPPVFFWVGDSGGRTMGPAPLPVIRELVTRGRLQGLTRGSRDGRTWVPIETIPELRAVLTGAAETAAQPSALQAEAERLTRELARLKRLSPRDRLGAPPSATVAECRGAFFAAVKRYHPSRLPPEAPPELSTAFIAMAQLLSEAMAEIDIESQATYATQEFVGWHEASDGSIQVELEVGPHDAHLFTDCAQAQLTNDGFFLPCKKALPLLQLVSVKLRFRQFSREVHGKGRVVVANPPGRPPGLGIRLISPSEEDRRFLQYFVKRVRTSNTGA